MNLTNIQPRLRPLLSSIVAISLGFAGQSAWAQFVRSCTAPPYAPRAADASKMGSWAISGEYVTNVAATSETLADLDGDGRPEMILSGGAGSVWVAMGYVPSIRRFEIVRTGRPALPFIENESVAGGRVSVGRMQAGGPIKIFTGSRFHVFDGATNRLEYVANFPAEGRIDTLDLDRDGVQKIVFETGDVVDTAFTRFVASPLGGGRLLGNFDRDANYELVGDLGRVLERRNGQWIVQTNLNWTSPSRDAIAAAGDLDGDGIDEFVSLTEGNSLRAYDFGDERTMWSVTARTAGTNDNAVQALTVADADGDGRQDVIVGLEGHPADPGEIQAFDGRTGAKLWAIVHPDIIMGAQITVANLDDEPQIELAYSTGRPVTGPFRMWVHDLRTRQLEHVQAAESRPHRALAIADIDSAPGDEVITAPPMYFGLPGTPVHIRDLGSMSAISTIDNVFAGRPTTAGLHAIAFGNVLGDARPELILGASDDQNRSRVEVMSWPNRQVLQTYVFGQGTHVVELGIGDLNGDGQQEIVAGTKVTDSSATTAEVYILDTRTGTVAWRSGSQLTSYGIIPSLRVADMNNDQRADIVVGGPELAIIDGVSQTITRSPSGPYNGIDIFDATGDGRLDVIAGTASFNGSNASSAGKLQILAAPSFQPVIEMQVCRSPIHGVVWNRFAPTRRQVFYTCETQIGIADLDSRTHQTVTPPTEIDLGMQGHLFLHRTANGDPRLIASSVFGAHSFAPHTNHAPFLAMYDACAASSRYFTHWRNQLFGGLRVYDSDGDPVSMSVTRTPSLGTLEVSNRTSAFEFRYQANPRLGVDLFKIQASDSHGALAPTVVSTVTLLNTAPLLNGRELSVEVGKTLSASFAGTDPDFDPLSYEIVEPPTIGTIAIANSQFLYQAPNTPSVRTTFKARAFDLVDYSEVATFTISVTAANPPPPPSNPPPSNPPSGGGSSGGGGGRVDLLLLAMLSSMLLVPLRRRKLMTSKSPSFAEGAV